MSLCWLRNWIVSWLGSGNGSWLDVGRAGDGVVGGVGSVAGDGAGGGGYVYQGRGAGRMLV